METQMAYIGRMTNNGKCYEVIEDQTNGLINIFFKNFKDGDVECWSLVKSNVQRVCGNDILSKTKKYWADLSNYSSRKLELLVSVQTFPMEFWNDIILPIKNGEQHNLSIKLVKA